MSTRLQKKQERIQHLLQCLIEESAKGTPIIVEGKHDLEALRALGVPGNVIEAKAGGKNRLGVVAEVEKLNAGEVILLLDFDRRGREWTEALKQCLERIHVNPNMSFWTTLLALAGRELKDIEGLAAYVRTLEQKAGQP